MLFEIETFLKYYRTNCANKEKSVYLALYASVYLILQKWSVSVIAINATRLIHRSTERNVASEKLMFFCFLLSF